MKPLNGICSVALLIAVALGISNSVQAQEAPQSTVSAPVAASEAPITADPAAKLSSANVAVTTVPAPAQAKVIPSPVPATEKPVKSALTAPNAVVDVPRGHDWIQATMSKYGVYPEAGTKFFIGPMPPTCGGADGCTTYTYFTDTGVAFDYEITIAPGELTEYLLFHEIAHARGIRDECAADNFARSVVGPAIGHYC